MLLTLHQWREFATNDLSGVAKLIPCFDGPYIIVNSMPEFLAYTLDLPNSLNIFPTFHSSQLKCFTQNNASLFPSCKHAQPGPIMTAEGLEEYAIEMNDIEVADTNAWYNRLVTDLKKIVGYLVTNSKNVKPSMFD